jgi:hypothetical protein
MDGVGLSVTLQDNACMRFQRVCRDNAIEDEYFRQTLADRSVGLDTSPCDA